MIAQLINDVRWLWSVSPAICDGKGLVLFIRRFRFLVRACSAYRSLSPLIHATQHTPLGQLMTARPETVGAVVWPYQCQAWDAKVRLARIRAHYLAIEEVVPQLDFNIDASIVLVDLDEIYSNMSVVLDQPKWFLHEGQLVINLFVGDTRMYSLAFSFYQKQEDLLAYVGAIQGRDFEGVLGAYRALTKACHGMRPRDLLLEVFRLFCSELGVKKIYAVSDKYSQFRSGYYGRRDMEKSRNYDEIWTERNGVKVDPTCYQLSVEPDWRRLEDIPSKKRAMYRRRYDMLNSIKQDMKLALATLPGKR